MPDGLFVSRAFQVVVLLWIILLFASETVALQVPPSHYPLQKQWLIERARSMDPSLAVEEAASGSYAPAGWSNRLGTVLTPVAEGVYTADRQFVWNDIDVGGRMTLVKLANGAGWFVHSPVDLDEALLEALDALVTTEREDETTTTLHVVSPNYEHVKYAGRWAEAFPERARMWACPGLSAKEPKVPWTGEIPNKCRPGDRAPTAMWDFSDVVPLHIDADCEALPLIGQPFFSEVLFYHPPSKSLMVTDAYWNYPSGDGITNAQLPDNLVGKDADYGPWELAPSVEGVPRGSRFWKWAMDQVYRPIYNRILLKRPAFQSTVANYLCGDEALDVEILIPCHGDIIRGKELIRDILKTHFAL